MTNTVIKPSRIQRKRTKGHKLPPNTVCVTRPGKYGNPYTHDSWATINGEFRQLRSIEEAVQAFRELCERTEMTFSELRGKNLACWCKEGACCHGDVILEIANRGGAV